MKIYGYKNEGLNPGDIEPSELAEITLVANADELRKIAKFIEAAAEGIEKREKNCRSGTPVAFAGRSHR